MAVFFILCLLGWMVRIRFAGAKMVEASRIDLDQAQDRSIMLIWQALFLHFLIFMF